MTILNRAGPIKATSYPTRNLGSIVQLFMNLCFFQVTSIFFLRIVARVENYPRISWCFLQLGCEELMQETLIPPPQVLSRHGRDSPQTQVFHHRPKRKVFSRKRNLPESHVYMIDLTAQIDTLNFNEYTISHLPDQDSACCYQDQRNCFLRLPQVTILALPGGKRFESHF